MRYTFLMQIFDSCNSLSNDIPHFLLGHFLFGIFQLLDFLCKINTLNQLHDNVYITIFLKNLVSFDNILVVYLF